MQAREKNVALARDIEAMRSRLQVREQAFLCQTLTDLYHTAQDVNLRIVR